MENCKHLGSENQQRRLEQLLSFARDNKYSNIKLLQEIQAIYGYLPERVLNFVATKLSLSVNELYSVASFYKEFSFSPKGKFPISVCLGTACYVKGAEEILNKIKMTLNIDDGECSEDGLFSLDLTRCIGCCGMAPVLTIGGDIFGNVKLSEVEDILNRYIKRGKEDDNR